MTTAGTRHAVSIISTSLLPGPAGPVLASAIHKNGLWTENKTPHREVQDLPILYHNGFLFYSSESQESLTSSSDPLKYLSYSIHCYSLFMTNLHKIVPQKTLSSVSLFYSLKLINT
jgi:hypothetical protein